MDQSNAVHVLLCPRPQPRDCSVALAVALLQQVQVSAIPLAGITRLRAALESALARGATPGRGAVASLLRCAAFAFSDALTSRGSTKASSQGPGGNGSVEDDAGSALAGPLTAALLAQERQARKRQVRS